MIPVPETPTACAGAAASYVFRRIASRAGGAYAPGIDEAIFLELHLARHGRGLDDVATWLAARSQALDERGYRLDGHRLTWTVPEIVRWVAGGRGYRGAVLATSYARLQPHGSATEAGEVIAHAVGLASEGYEDGGAGELVMIDPWSRTGNPTEHPLAVLELAHRERDGAALLLHWRGWT